MREPEAFARDRRANPTDSMPFVTRHRTMNMIPAMAPTATAHDASYLRSYHGLLRGVMSWRDLDALWARLHCLSDGGWYVYTVREAPPAAPASRDEFERFLAEIARLLRDEHQEDYCGIVYADDFANPGFVKIFDPNNLGMVCGSSASPPLPGWTLSRMAPDDLQQSARKPGRRRWWRKLPG